MSNPKKPTALRILMGNPSKRPLPKNEPKPAPVAPACPNWITGPARAEWRRIAPELEKIGLLTRIDRAALAAYCRCYARWRQAEETIDREGHTITTDKGNVIQHPAVGEANRLLIALRAYIQEFGLSPAARARVEVPQQKEDDEFASLLQEAERLGRR